MLELFTKPIDRCGELLAQAGYSHGYTAALDVTARVWLVTAHKGEHRIVAHAPTLERAYRDAWEQAQPT